MYGGDTRGEALSGPGQPAARPLLPATVRPLAVAIVVVCALVIAVQAVWIRHGMETGWVDTAVDAKVEAVLGGHPLLLAVLVWPGAPKPVVGMAAALVLACILRHRYSEAVLVAISVSLATAITELVLKPFIGGTSWGNPFPSGHVTSVAALATAVTVLLARRPARMPRKLCLLLGFAAFLTAAAVAIGVIGANMHHFSDTVGGAAIGTGTVLLTALTLDLLSRRFPSTKMKPGAPTRELIRRHRPNGRTLHTRGTEGRAPIRS
jgi:membrane-associated phospholipid phosphatase